MSSSDFETWNLQDLLSPEEQAAYRRRSQAETFAFQPLNLIPPRPQRLTQAEAAAKAQEILEAAKAKAQEVERLAYEQGFSQGKKDGREVGERSLEQAIQRVHRLALSLEEAKEELFRRREADLLELVLLIAKKLVAHELVTQPQVIQQIIASAFRHLADTENIRLLVHPQDYKLVRQADLSAWPPGLTLVADPNLTPGGFHLETTHGDIDGTLQTRWARVSRIFDDLIRSPEKEEKEEDFIF